jgi:S-adenosylmethionine decarboxylase
VRDLAPHILRQRLLLEGYYTVPVDRGIVEGFLTGIAAKLELRTYGAPIIHSPGGIGKPENQGFDAFIPLIDSGISLYVWSARQFFAAVLFTCKSFEVSHALDFTREYFCTRELEFREF